MLEFKSEQVKVNKNNNNTFFVKNNEDRKVSKNTFKNLYPLIKIDGKIYKTRGVDCLSISFVPKNSIIGIKI
jgi:hypothetical protein